MNSTYIEGSFKRAENGADRALGNASESSGLADDNRQQGLLGID